MIRVVFDTNILFSAAYKRVGVPAQVLDLVVRGILTPCIPDAVMAEYQDVLTRLKSCSGESARCRPIAR